MSAPKPYETNPTPTHSFSDRPCHYNIAKDFNDIYSKEKSFYLTYGKHCSRRLQNAHTRPAEGNIHTWINFISSRISE